MGEEVPPSKNFLEGFMREGFDPLAMEGKEAQLKREGFPPTGYSDREEKDFLIDRWTQTRGKQRVSEVMMSTLLPTLFLSSIVSFELFCSSSVQSSVGAEEERACL